MVVAALALVAGAIHAVAMVDHFSHWWAYGVFFLGVTYAQVLWSVWLYRHRDDQRTLRYGALGSLALVGVWLVSRTVGIPIGPQAGVEPVGAMDVMSSIDELVTAGLIATIVAPSGRAGRRLRVIGGTQSVRLGIMLGSASLLAILLGSHHHH